MEEDCEKAKVYADSSPGPGGGGWTGGDEEHITVNQRAARPAGAEQVWAGVAHTQVQSCSVKI